VRIDEGTTFPRNCFGDDESSGRSSTVTGGFLAKTALISSIRA
jgi:hypothetical protein